MVSIFMGDAVQQSKVVDDGLFVRMEESRGKCFLCENSVQSSRAGCVDSVCCGLGCLRIYAYLRTMRSEVGYLG